ncbi:MAG: thiamine phosphate synthase [Rhizobiaceae bacterium]
MSISMTIPTNTSPQRDIHSTDDDITNRCRIILIVNSAQAAEIDAVALDEILKAGDVASIIFTPQSPSQSDVSQNNDGLMDEAIWQPLLEPLVEITQKNDVAAIVSEYSRTAGRVSADGFQLGQDPQSIEAAIKKYAPKMMIGASNVKTRHNAMVIGELQPAYLMFGKPGGDIRPEPHPKNLALGEWWASMVEISAVVLGGNQIESVVEVANTGVEFVALSAAIFAPNDHVIEIAGAAKRLQQANQHLDEHAPRFIPSSLHPPDKS